jgi:hypothetical protein
MWKENFHECEKNFHKCDEFLFTTKNITFISAFCSGRGKNWTQDKIFWHFWDEKKFLSQFLGNGWWNHVKTFRKVNWVLFRFQLAHSHKRSICKQGDQISLWKIRPRCSPILFLSKILQHIFYSENSRPIILATSVIKKPAQSNQSPIGRKFAQPGHPVCQVSEQENGFYDLFSTDWQFRTYTWYF